MRYCAYIFSSLFFLLITAHNSYGSERFIIIVTCSYNNQQWYQWNLDSVFGQDYSNYRLIYVDDCSTDNTYELVKAYVEKQPNKEHVTLIHNKERRRALANLYDAIHSCPDHAIIVILDGDDRLAHSRVLDYINKTYDDGMIWLTYGQFKDYPNNILGFCKPMPWEIVKNNAFRSYPDAPSHLRTFYAGLFKHIKKEDLFYENDFFPMTYDLAIMFPMIEMAREGHFTFIPDVLLDYNTMNDMNDHKISYDEQAHYARVIRSRSPYEPIKSPFFTTSGCVASMKIRKRKKQHGPCRYHKKGATLNGTN